MKLKPWLASLLVLSMTIGAVPGKQQTPRLIPFQGRLTDSTGTAVPDGMKLIQFQIYNEPSGGQALWAGEVHRTTVNGGLVNVMLGSKNALPANRPDDPDRSFFDASLYLQITVDGNGDEAIDKADPPMLPRQSILPTVFAQEAGNGRKLAGHDWSAILENGNENPSVSRIAESKLPIGIAVPMVGFLMWWGSKSEIPENFEICDGSLPTTPGAMLKHSKPDMRGRFPRGASDLQTDIASSPTTGGSDRIEERQSGLTTLTTSQIPFHRHPITDKRHTHGLLRMVGGTGGPHAGILDRNFQTGNFGTSLWSDIPDDFASFTGINTTEGEGGGQGHQHPIPSHDNRPAFLEMFFIIRVK